MEKPSKTIKQSFSLRQPVSSLAKKRAGLTSRIPQISASDPASKVRQLFTDATPSPAKLSARPLITKGLTVDKLLAKTRPQQLELSAAVVVKNTKRMWHKKSSNPCVVAETYSRKTGKDAKGFDKYVTWVEGLNTDKGKKFSETLVKVGCTCAFFTFFCEYALAKHGAATVMFSNGQPPVVRNPSEKAILCKHIVKLCKKISDKGV